MVGNFAFPVGRTSDGPDLKGTETLIITMFYMKYLNKP